MQSDGKIIAAGNREMYILCARYLANGRLDSTFGVNGKVYTDISVKPYGYGSYGGDVNGLVLLPNGKFLVGAVNYNPGQPTCAVFRYNNNGSLDTTFNHVGYVLTPMNGLLYCKATLVQPDGKILQAGYTDSAFVIRLDTAGHLDPTFNHTGITRFTPGEVRGMALRPDGRVVIAGSINDSTFATWRCNADGSVDNAFGNHGCITTAIGNRDNSGGYGLAIQPDGKILVGGAYEPNPYPDNIYKFALVRYKPDAGAGVDSLPKAGNGLSIYPNPANNQLSVATQDGSPMQRLCMYSIDGKLMYSGAKMATAVIPTGALPAGLYTVSAVLQDGRASVHKVTVIH